MVPKTVRAFLDTNVILSGFISEKGAPRIILDLLTLRLPFLQGLTGQYNILEIERNLNRKLSAALPVYIKYFPLLNLEIIPLPTQKDLHQYAEVTVAKDVPVLVSALKGKADYLITGDKKDLLGRKQGEKIFPFMIVDPADFLMRLPGFLF